MRKQSFERLLASTILAVVVATPAVSIAAPDRIIQISPPPPSINGQPQRRREAPPVPPQPVNNAPVQRSVPMPEPRAQAPEPRTQVIAPAPVAAPAPEPVVQAPTSTTRETDSAVAEIRSALDKPLAANDAQITDRLRATGKQMSRFIDREPERKAAEAFYAARGVMRLYQSSLTIRYPQSWVLVRI